MHIVSWDFENWDVLLSAVVHFGAGSCHFNSFATFWSSNLSFAMVFATFWCAGWYQYLRPRFINVLIKCAFMFISDWCRVGFAFYLMVVFFEGVSFTVGLGFRVSLGW